VSSSGAGSHYIWAVRLTEREQQVFELIGKGRTTKEIATALKLSAGTIGNHRKSICRKLNGHSTAELVCRAAFGRLVRSTALIRALPRQGHAAFNIYCPVTCGFESNSTSSRQALCRK